MLSLHSSPIATPGTTDVGGMNLYVRRLADDLSRRGLSVDVFTRRTDRYAPDVSTRVSGARIVQISAGPIRRVPKSTLPLHLPAMAAGIRDFADGNGRGYDLLHSHYWISGLAAIRYRAMSTRRIPHVHMFHTLARVKEFYSGRADTTDSYLRADGERTVLAQSDVIVGSTERELNDMVQLYCREPRHYEVIPPGVDFTLFKPLDRMQSRRLLGIHAQRVVLFVGRQDRLKGLDILLGSVARLPAEIRNDLKIVLVGGHDRPNNPETARQTSLITKLGLEANVDVRGTVAQEDLPAYYSASDICAVPSSYESFGMVAIEAMACQTPVVAFNVGGLAASIRQGETGFLAHAGDLSDYATRLSQALTCTQLDRMGRRARLSVRPYSWDSVASRTLETYEACMRSTSTSFLRALAGG